MDTQKITSEILKTGLTEQELADLVPCSQSTINAFRNGKRGQRPSLAIGVRLLDLHRERCSLGEVSTVDPGPHQQQRRRQTDQDAAAKSGGDKRRSETVS
ncbi:hypothetical protein ACFSQU_18025 [Massilia sp. GCM10020059]|uniref:Helix-turn-helix transcriptional regulator n=1 Tax=Massilia agrisoli TaxID=2892444 RepID=A0ABS8IW13_9BURK|nr:helix-turn-helix transcriptional regulator [Massilia agrisoli]MCC6071440.1 helix-turn-helix transcriptional regulator [Massilia agrisoli]